MLLYDSPAFTLFHNKEHGWLHLEWRGAHTHRSVEEHCGLVLEAVRRTGSKKVLNDSTEALDGWDQATQWLGESFFPQMAREGVTAIAILNAMDWPARLCLQAIMLHATQPAVQLFDFDEMASAQRWLSAN